MIKITLPDGNVKVFQAPLTASEIALSINKQFKKTMVAAKVDGNLVDLDTIVDTDRHFEVVHLSDHDGLEVLRHSTAHLLAEATKSLFPEVQVTIGPVVEDGFYYDFYYPKGFNEDDLHKIARRMAQIAKQNHSIKWRNEGITKKIFYSKWFARSVLL